MVAQQFYPFKADYLGMKNQFCVTGRYKLLQGAALDDWQADYTLVVYYTYCTNDIEPQAGTERSVYISFSGGKSSVIDISFTENRNMAFFDWLKDVICFDMKDKLFAVGGNQHQLQIAW